VITAAIMVPSARRPGSARRLAGAFAATASPSTTLAFAVDDDDPELDGYLAVSKDFPWTELHLIEDSPHRIGPILNDMAGRILKIPELRPDFLGFMGDDHLPLTHGWDTELAGELRDRPGVAYGNDLHQGPKLPTACLISSRLVYALGYFVPPGMGHLFLDDFWLRLGHATHLAYRDDVIIEHLHPDAGKAEHDATYAAAGRDAGTWAADRDRLDAYLRGGGWDAAMARIAHLRPVPGAL
jgi:hypothetical protein